VKKLFLQSILFLLPALFYAQTYPFANYGVKDGLSQSNVSGIIQDSSGFFWLATESGISRFDGKNFVNYTTEDGLADNNVSAIFLDRSNRIWLGHENGSVTVYDGKTFTPIHSKAFPKDKKIYGFYQERSGSLWVCTASGGAVKIIDPGKVGNARSHIRVYSAKDGLSQYVFSVVEDKQGHLWFLTDVGIKYFNKSTRTFEFFRPANMPPGQITSLAPDKNSNLLIGTSSGAISRYNPQTKEFQVITVPADLGPMSQGISPNFIYTILEDSKGNIWASVFNYGVCRYEPATKKITVFNTSNGLGANKIKSISEDREGNILFGTLGEGVEVFASEKFISFSKNDGLADNHVWAVCKDRNGHYWFGTNEGITVYNPRETGASAFKTIGFAEGLPSLSIRAIVADKNGDLWIGTWGGKTVKYSLQQGQVVQVPALNEIVNPYVSCLMVDKKNNLWIGTIEGVVKYEIHSGLIKTMRTINGLSDNDVTAFCEDDRGQVWIGSKQKGITVFDGKTYKIFGRENGLTYGSITSIAEDSKHRMWVGTEGGGVFVYDLGKFYNYKIRDGLVSDFITLIIADEKNNMWLGTNKGLTKYEADKKIFRSYAVSDGFTGLETKSRSTYHDDEGNLWFGTVNGVFKYSPKQDIPVSQEPIVKLTRLRVNLQDYPVQDQITLSHEKNSLHFDFVGISLSNPQGVTYKTKLEGYDKDFKPANDQDFEIFSNLPPGNYEFKLIACNSSGSCSSMPFSIKIVITPPFWKTWWFYLIMLVLIISILLTYIKLRERKLRQEKKILEDKVRERTAEVVEKNIELDEKNKDITASIRYAKRIQDAILPPDDFVKRHMPNTFVLFKPKDIVSGDFYWIADKGEHIIFTAVDCTGHGVPGAFMSIVGHNLLDRIVVEQNILKPSLILDELNKSVSDTLRQSDHEDNAVRDGMDIALCVFNRKTAVLQYAGAYNPLWLITNNDFKEIKADKFPIGNLRAGEVRKFTNHEIQLVKGDTVYVFSDGYADQFGGPAGKKFKASSFKQLILENGHLNMQQQGELLNRTIEGWRGNLEQVDDILVIGTRL
jgi:ligand-binding sensor domain-containing protein/serine phosphatase RsbU (regulator of sigma subunit)